MPYLKIINFDNPPSNGFTYLEHFNNILKQQSSNNNTGRNALTHSFNRVEEIRYSPYDRSSQHHVGELFKACYALRESLTHLNLRLLETDLTVNNQTGTYLQLLPQFKYLTHLTLDSGKSQNDVDDSNLSVVNIFKVCPNLVKFSLLSSFPLLEYEESAAARSNDFETTSPTPPEDSAATTEIDNMMIDTDQIPVVAPAVYHSYTNKQQQQQPNRAENYCPRLKSIGLCAPTINLKQLMDVYVRSSLGTLELEINRDVFDLRVQKYGKQELERFGSLLGSIEN